MLPAAGVLTEAARAVAPGERDLLLDFWRPEIDELADTVTIAAWVGIRPRSIHREREPDRARADGRTWPEPSRWFGRTPVWTYRAVILHRAAMPGPGNRRQQPGAGGAVAGLR